MKFSCNKKEFLALLRIASSVTSKHKFRMAIEYVKLVAEECHVILAASDLDDEVTLQLTDFLIDEYGEVLLSRDNVKTIKDILKSIEDKDIGIYSDGTTLSINGGQEIKLPDLNPKCISVRNHNAEEYYETTASNLCKLIDRVLFATDSDRRGDTVHAVVLCKL